MSYRDGKWLAPRPVHQDGWKINACPVNGPALAASGKRVWAAWYTAAGDTPRVQIVSSLDAGLTFASPLRLDGGSPQGRVAVVLLPDGSAVGSWIEKKTGGGAELRVRRVGADGQLGTVHTVAELDAARKTGFPKWCWSPRASHDVDRRSDPDGRDGHPPNLNRGILRHRG